MTKFGFDPKQHPAYLTLALGAGQITDADGRGLSGVCQTVATASAVFHQSALLI